MKSLCFVLESWQLREQIKKSNFPNLKSTHPNNKEVLVISHELRYGIAEDSILVHQLDRLLDLGGGDGGAVPPSKTDWPRYHR